jgi:hypothetical protein
MINLHFTFTGSVDPSLIPGRIINQAAIANRLTAAEKTKKEFAVPVSGTIIGIVMLLMKNGKIIALKAEPIFPSIFIVAETTPEFAPPISMQSDQLGAMVISTPNTAIENIRVKARAEFPGRRVIIISPATETANPAIAGIFLERI